MPESGDEVYEEERYQNAKYYKADPPPMRYKRSRSRSYSNYREPPKVAVRRSPSASRDRSRYDRSARRPERVEKSYSPPQKKKEYALPTDQSSANNIIGVFGLSVYTKEERIRELFARYGKIERINMIIDAKTKKSRGFCFIYFANVEDASAAKDHCNGIEIDDRRVRVDYSVTQRAHSPTPGYYQGKPTRREERERGMRHERSERSSRPSRRDERDHRHEPSRERRQHYSPPRAPRTPPQPSRSRQYGYEERKRKPRPEYEEPRNGRYRSRS